MKLILTDEQLLAKLNSRSFIERSLNVGAKRGMQAEKERGVWAREASRRGLIGMPSKAKHRYK